MNLSRRCLAPSVALCLLLAGACKTEPAAKPPPPIVTVAMPIEREVANYRDYTGVTAATESVEIRARVPGYLESIEFADSANVKKGDLLFVIERESYQAERDAAYAEFKSAEVELARAELELGRVERAARTRAVSEQEVTTRRADRDKAMAGLLASQARLSDAELRLEYTLVRSPIDGRAGRHLVDVGNLVGAGESTLLTTVVNMDPIHVYFDVDERSLTRYLRNASGVERGQALERAKVFVAIGDEQDHQHEGRLDYIDNVVDAATGTVRVRAVLPNSEALLYPGLFARVRVIGAVEEQVLLVQERAISTDLGGKYLLVLSDEDIVERRYVELGALHRQMRAVHSGIEAGERYIIDGLQKARPGLSVTARPQEASAGD